MELQDTTSSKYRILMGLISLTAPPPPPPPSPTVTITGFSFIGTVGSTSSQPTVIASNTNATSLSVAIYESDGPEDRGYSLLTTLTTTPTGNNTVTYSGATIGDRWYYFTVTVTNVTGSASASTYHAQNLVPPTPASIVLSATQLVAYGTTQAFPYTYATLTNWTTDIYWACYESIGAGFPNDRLIESGTYINPDIPVNGLISTAFTPIGSRFYFFACDTGKGDAFDVSSLSPPNYAET